MNDYTVYVHPRALQEIRHLPGHMRQRIKRTIDALAVEPRPPKSIELKVELPRPLMTLHRLRMDRWRVIYTIDERDKMIDLLAIRQRPPYDYADLAQLLEDLL